MLLVGLWHGGLSDESVEDMTNANLHVMRFSDWTGRRRAGSFGTSRFRTRLTASLWQPEASRSSESAGHQKRYSGQGGEERTAGRAAIAVQSVITRLRYVVERTFGSQARWFNAKILHYRGLAKAHAWHVLKAMAYNLKRLPGLFVEGLMKQEKCAF